MASNIDMAILLNKSSRNDNDNEKKTSTNTDINHKQDFQTNFNNNDKTSKENSPSSFNYANKMSAEEVYNLAKDFFKGALIKLSLFSHNEVKFLYSCCFLSISQRWNQSNSLKL